MQKIHRSAQECPHCGFALSDLDDLHEVYAPSARKLNDVAGVLRMKDRRKASAWFDQFEQRFPQLFFSVHFGALEERHRIREVGIWLLNKTVYEDVDETRSNDGGILLVVDVNSKTASISFGYHLDCFLSEEETFDILSKAHPYLLDGNYLKSLGIVMKGLTVLLSKKSSHAKKHEDYYQRMVGKPKEDLESEEDLVELS